MCLKNKIEQTEIGKGQVAIFWLGQAGFMVKDSEGKKVVIDPYLSNYGHKMKDYKAFKRLSPILIEASELDADHYITTHLHFDHFDFESVPVAAKTQKTKFYGPISCYDEMLKMEIAKERVTLLEEGHSVDADGIKILPVYADHGELAPDAVGIYLEMGGQKLYFSGDTAYRPEKIQNVVDLKPDVAILSVNGAFGNLDAEEGAKVANLVGAKLAIPCHVWTFMEHGGDLAAFGQSMSALAPNCQPYFMYQGECLVVE